MTLMFLPTGLAVASDKGLSSFSEEDRARISLSSRTDWGKGIIAGLEDLVAERSRHSLVVPPVEAGHIHNYACPVHNLTFKFRWDHPHEHLCEACGKEWTGVDQYDWAWINVVHEQNRKYLQACSFLYLASGDEEYAGRVRDMLADYAGKYPGWMEHSVDRNYSQHHTGKMFSQSLDEAVWFCTAARAYDAVRAAFSEDDRRRIEQGLFREGAELLLRRKDSGNWQVWHNAALTAIAVVLEDSTIADVALNDPECGYRALMDKFVHDDGWWNEGSPIYHFYPLEAMVYTAEAARCFGFDLYDEKLERMFTAPLRSAYQTLLFPSFNDGWYGESLIAQAGLYEMADVRFGGEEFNAALDRIYRETARESVLALYSADELMPVQGMQKQGSEVFPDTGFAMLRSKRLSVVFKYGSHGGFHGHPDKLSIAVHDGEKEIVSDFGTPAYGTPDYTRWYRKTLAHNTVCVDGRDQAKKAGRLERFKGSRHGADIRAVADSLYDGVHMERRLRLRRNVLKDVFCCTSEEEHSYDYVLLFNAKPAFVGTSEACEVQLADEPYCLIRDASEMKVDKCLTVIADGNVIRIGGKDRMTVITGVASGIPPTNPGVKTKTGSECRPVQDCYPVIIRTVGNDMEISARWKISRSSCDRRARR